jgi:hypothetical protein
MKTFIAVFLFFIGVGSVVEAQVGKNSQKNAVPPFVHDLGGHIAFHTGDVGTIRKSCWAHIIQIVDENNMLVSVEASAMSSSPNDIAHSQHLVWIKGISTKDLSDGDDTKNYSWAIPLEVKGSTKYKTSDGSSKTVPLLEAKDANDKFRTWTTSDGIFTLEAEFISKQGNSIKLKKRNETVVVVTTNKLSNEDLQWIKSETAKK